MKYREAKTECSKGCGRPRVANQRYCQECRRAAQTTYRNKKHAELRELVAIKAQFVALQIDRFNRAANKEAA